MTSLRVFIVTEDDPLYVKKFFEIFFSECPRDEVTLSGMIISRAFHESIWRTARRIHRFYGTFNFIRLGLRYMLAKVLRADIQQLARKRGVPIFRAVSVNDPSFVAQLRTMRIDLLVSVAAPEVFQSPLLQVARLGSINIHSGRLPKYRGMMPTFWQMRHGESEVAITIHEMAEKIDAGGVIATRSLALKPHDTLDRVIVETKREGARAMIEVLRQTAEQGKLPVAQPLDMTQASYFRFPDPENVRAFHARGYRLL